MELIDAKAIVEAKSKMIDAVQNYETISKEMLDKYGDSVFYVANEEIYDEAQEKPYTKLKIVDRMKEMTEKGYCYKNTKFTPAGVEITTVKNLPKK